MKVAVVDYGSGNLASASRALMLVASRLGMDADVCVTADAEYVARALAAVPGMWQAIQSVTARGNPFLGICVGMQLMAQRGLEHDITRGFGWIPGDIAEMPAPGLRLPQIGWNALDFVPGCHKLLDGLIPGDHVYFVHSYALTGGDPDQAIATTDYGGPVVAMVAAGNRAGTQFHVEKSQEVGLRILANFLQWSP